MAPARVNPPIYLRDNEAWGDMAAWRREHSGDNSDRMDRLRRNLRRAREAELTDRQRQVLRMYFEEGKSMTLIARRLSLNKSTVCRTLHRALRRLEKCLKYSL